MDTDSRQLNFSWSHSVKDWNPVVTPSSIYLDPRRLLKDHLQCYLTLRPLPPNLPHQEREELVVGRRCALQRLPVKTVHAGSRELTKRTKRSCSRCLTLRRVCLSASSCSAQMTGKTPTPHAREKDFLPADTCSANHFNFKNLHLFTDCRSWG